MLRPALVFLSSALILYAATTARAETLPSYLHLPLIRMDAIPTTIVTATPTPTATSMLVVPATATPITTATPTRNPAQCHPSYPTVCIPPPPPDLNCPQIPFRNFLVLPPDPHNFDGNHDGVGCED